MKKIFNTLSVMMFASVLAACNNFVTPEVGSEQPSLKIARDTMLVPADRVASADTSLVFDEEVYDTLKVTSNRSWTASVVTDDGGAWLKLGETEFVNVSGVSQAFDLPVEFERNRKGVRSGRIVIRAVDVADSVVLHVVQNKFIPELRVEVIGDSSSVSALNGNISLFVRSNTSWSVVQDGSQSTVSPELSTTDGVDVGIVNATFADNFNDESAQYARLVFKAADCEDFPVVLTQRQSDNYFYVDGEVAGKLSPLDETVTIPLKSNGDWTAEISNCTFVNAKLTPSGGSGTVSGFTFSADHGADPEVVEKHATVTIRRQGKQDIVLNFSQEGSIHFNCGHFNPAYTTATSPYTAFDNPFDVTFPSSYTSLTYADSVVTCTMRNGGYMFNLYGKSNGIWVNNKGQLLMIGKTKNDYILFPALPGYRLSKMVYEASFRCCVNYTVRTADGSSVINGGEFSSTATPESISAEHHDVHTHVFPETKAGERYRLNLEEEGSSISIKDLCLIYEKVSE